MGMVAQAAQSADLHACKAIKASSLLAGVCEVARSCMCCPLPSLSLSHLLLCRSCICMQAATFRWAC